MIHKFGYTRAIAAAVLAAIGATLAQGAQAQQGGSTSSYYCYAYSQSRQTY
jgi:hypothetical protein